MGLWETACAHARAWSAASALASEIDSDRNHAMQTLRDLGPVSLPCLHMAVRRTHAPRAQFAAAVVLHWLGDNTGLAVLKDALRWQLPSTGKFDSKTTKDLEAAFVAIGPADAVPALMQIWKQLRPGRENRRVLKTICSIWAKLRDPTPLGLLNESSLAIPDLYEEYVPTFGGAALPFLEQMAHDALPARRSLAVRTARHIRHGQSAAILLPLLRDPDPAIRALTAQALEAMQNQGCLPTYTARPAILNALQEGFSSAQGVEILLRQNMPAYTDLLHLVLRWDQPGGSPGDTLDAVLAALPALALMPVPNAQLAVSLGSVLARRPVSSVIAGIARVLSARGRSGEPTDAALRAILLKLLPHPDMQARTEVAQALAVLNEPIGKRLQQSIEAAWPQAGLLDKLQTLFRVGSDPDQVMQWFTRVSKETVDRLNGAGNFRSFEVQAASDGRIAELLRLLLINTLNALHETMEETIIEQHLALSVACIRAIGRMARNEALTAHTELIGALHICKLRHTPAPNYGEPPRGIPQDTRADVAAAIRTAAAQTLLQLYGASSFPLFLHALYAPQTAVRATAIVFLGELADIRALPHLQNLLTSGPKADVTLAARATEAINRIRHVHPETMTLLRASEAADCRPATLLRPAAGNPNETAADILLRPTRAEARGLPPDKNERTPLSETKPA